MITYEVTTTLLSEEIKAEWLGWMTGEHIQHVVDTGCFTAAELISDTENPLRYSVRYLAVSMEDLQRYMLEFAPKLRGEFTKRFSGKADISRAIWALSRRFEPSEEI